MFLFVLFGLNTFHVCIIFFNVLYFPCDPSPFHFPFHQSCACVSCDFVIWLLHGADDVVFAGEQKVIFCWFMFLFCFFILVWFSLTVRIVNEGKITETPTQYHQDLWAISFLSHSSFRNLTPPTLFGFLKTVSLDSNSRALSPTHTAKCSACWIFSLIFNFIFYSTDFHFPPSHSFFLINDATFWENLLFLLNRINRVA